LLVTELAGRPRDPRPAARAAGLIDRHPVRLLLAVGCRGSVFGRVGLLGLGEDIGGMPREPVTPPVSVDRGIRGDFRAVDRDRAKMRQPFPGRYHEYLREQVGEHLASVDTEPGDRGVIWTVLGAQHPKRNVRDAQSLDL